MATLEPGTTGRRPRTGARRKAGRRKPRDPPKAVRKQQALTMSVPDAGRIYLGLSKNSSDLAAERGDIPTIKIGKKLRVPVRLMERLLDKAGSSTLEEAAAAS